jgi:hypothetical protein
MVRFLHQNFTLQCISLKQTVTVADKQSQLKIKLPRGLVTDLEERAAELEA